MYVQSVSTLGTVSSYSRISIEESKEESFQPRTAHRVPARLKSLFDSLTHYYYLLTWNDLTEIE